MRCGTEAVMNLPQHRKFCPEHYVDWVTSMVQRTIAGGWCAFCRIWEADTL